MEDEAFGVGLDLGERGGRGGGEALEFDDEGFRDGGCGRVTAGGEEEAKEEKEAHGGGDAVISNQ
jgi:hypothetical protein